jgi:ABC-2 type transport system permease protein
MMNDIVTIVWKELKEIFFQRGKKRGGWMGLLISIGIFGIVLPLQSGPEWVDSFMPLIFLSWISFLLVGSVIADSFAGERERHTLETLLATRLSDQSILIGKVATAVAYSFGMVMACALLSLITINIVHMDGALILYPLVTAIAIPIFSLLIAGLASGMGVFISLRASTVRQAAQAFSISYLVLFIPLFVFPMLPQELQGKLITWLMSVDFMGLGIAAAGLLFVLDVFLLWAALKRFQRSKLILD